MYMMNQNEKINQNIILMLRCAEVLRLMIITSMMILNIKRQFHLQMFATCILAIMKACSREILQMAPLTI